MPWHRSGAPLSAPCNVSKRPYRGLNVLMLWATAHKHGYETGTWATYKQWQELSAQVRKGEKATTVIVWKVTEQEAEDKEREKRFFARAYWVFNASQVSGYTPEAPPVLPEEERVAHAEQFFAALDAQVEHGGYEAYYLPQSDAIHMPHFRCFRNALAYYATLGHEHVHWSGHKTRLDRDLSRRFGHAAYAMEELVAELGAAFLCAELGLTLEPRVDHSKYIASWLKALKSDPRALFAGASKAQAAVDWMKAKQEGRT